MKLMIMATWVMSSLALAAQSTNESAEVMRPIQYLFDGMNKGDSALVHKAFMDDATFATIGTDKDGNPYFRRGDLKRFLNAMAAPRAEIYTEPIWNVKMDIDGNMAQVWANYAFYIGKSLHHCGVDAFQLFKANDGWKIYSISDTRQQEGCEVPREIQDKFK